VPGRRLRVRPVREQQPHPADPGLGVRLGFPVDGLAGGLAGGRMGLHIAAWNGDLATVRRLLELGASPLVRDTEHGTTPRDWAAWAYQGEVAHHLSSAVGRWASA
jgi:hypothetical protein